MTTDRTHCCHRECNQGRFECPRRAQPEPEFPPLNRKTAVIALAVVALAVFLSALFPMGVTP